MSEREEIIEQLKYLKDDPVAIDDPYTLECLDSTINFLSSQPLTVEEMREWMKRPEIKTRWIRFFENDEIDMTDPKFIGKVVDIELKQLTRLVRGEGGGK